jgi:UDP-glucose 4-epimerase
MKVLVTGATGFVGRPVVQSLIRNGHSVLALSRKKKESPKEKCLRWLQADLAHPSEYLKDIHAFEPEAVVHLAWQDIPDFSFDTSRKNLNQSIDLLSFVLDLGCCKKIMVSGSDKELNRPSGVCHDSEQGAPNNGFSWAKHSLRSWLEIVCAKNTVSLGWFRIFFCYGPGQRSASLLPTLLKHLAQNNLPDLRTPKNANDYVFVYDVANSFSKAMSIDFHSGIYNIGSGFSTTVLEMCRISEQVVRGTDELTLKLESKTKDIKPTIDFWADLTRTNKHINWQPTTSLAEGIKQTLEWIRS